MERIVRRKNEVGSILRVNSGLCAVEELNVVRGEPGIREGRIDAMRRCRRVYAIEDRDLVGGKLRRVMLEQVDPRQVQGGGEPEAVRIGKDRIGQWKDIDDLNIGVAGRHLLQ